MTTSYVCDACCSGEHPACIAYDLGYCDCTCQWEDQDDYHAADDLVDDEPDWFAVGSEG